MPSPEDVRLNVAKWQSKLIELNKRNPLYCLPANSRGLLPLSGESSEDLFKHLSSTRRNLLFTQVEALENEGTDPKVRRKHNCRELSAEDFKKLSLLPVRAASTIREQGINILYVVFGVLEWTDPANGQLLQSPLLLLPVTLERLPGGDVIRLTRLDDEIELNPTLVYRLSQPDLNVPLPELPDEDGFSPAAYLEAIRLSVAEKSSWNVVDAAILGRFSFLKMAMYRDLERQMAKACEHPIIEALAGNPLALSRLPAVDIPELTEIDNAMKGHASHCVLDADPSQQRAILAAKSGQSFVLQGPPGTGKTQTIANIIAEFIADGKRVLFVSQKMAALDAVFKRLRDKRLHDLCLEAHSHKADKRAFVEQLRVAHAAQQRRIDLQVEQQEMFDTLKHRLSTVVDELHIKRQPLDISVYEANGRLALLASTADLMFSFLDPHEVNAQRLTQLEELAQRLAHHTPLFPDAHSHLWLDVIADRFTPDFQVKVRTLLEALQTAVIQSKRAAADASQLCGMSEPTGIQSAKSLETITKLIADSPSPPQSWLVATDREMDELHTRSLLQHDLQHSYVEARSSLLSRWTDRILSLPFDDLRDRLTGRNAATLQSALGDDWQTVAESQTDEILAALAQAQSSAEAAARTISSLSVRCALPPTPSIGNGLHILQVTEIVAEDLRPQAPWFDFASLAALTNQARQAAAVFKAYIDNKKNIGEAYSDEIYRLDLTELCRRFSVDYSSLTHYFKPQYYKDKQDIRRCLRPGVSPNGRSLEHDLKTARDTVDAKAWMDKNDTDLYQQFGPHYTNVSTEWTDLETRLNRQSNLLTLLPGGKAGEILARTMIDSGPEITAVREISAQLKDQLQQVDYSIGQLSQNVKMSTLPFTNLPFSQTSLIDLGEWLSLVASSLADHHAACKTTRTCAINTEAQSARNLLDALSEAEAIRKRNDEIEAEAPSNQIRYQSFYTGVSTNWNAIRSALDSTRQLKSYFGSDPMPPTVIRLASEGSPTERSGLHACATRLSEATGMLQERLNSLLDILPAHRLQIDDIPLHESHFEEIERWTGSKIARLPELEQWIDFQNLRKECDLAGLLSFYETVISRQVPANEIVQAFRKRFYQLWYAYITDTIPALRQFRGGDHTGLIEQFQQMDRQQIESAPDRIRASVQRRGGKISAAFGQAASLKRLLAARRLKPIRKILTDIPDVLFQYKPCLLMSPLSVSLYLEPEVFEFDLVIFDEASQIFIEDALCSLLRAKQVIIAGDTQQLPPTAFFKSLRDEEGDEDAEEDLTNYESILQASSLISANGSGFAEHELTWHYRSRHDSLIAFSKVHFYDRIIPFPAPTSTSAVSIVNVPDGIYYPGEGKRNNPVEAAVVVDAVIEHALAHPDRSIGVITFNEAQKSCIEDLIDERGSSSTEIERLLNEEGSEGFFVKNIENVQGDERDVIFLSICFAKTPGGALSMNFGPLNKDGGERRLNVAITRARLLMKIVSSVASADIDMTKTDRTGPKLLKQYLEYAQSGGLSLEGEKAQQSEFEAAVEAAVQQAGYKTRKMVGRFGYAVSIGVLKPNSTDDFILGIECDGTAYRDAETVRARDRLRGEVLYGLGWNIHRVWSCDWIRNPAAELEKIVNAITAGPVSHTPQSAERPQLRYAAPNSVAPPVVHETPAIYSVSSDGPLSTPRVAESLTVNNAIAGTTYFKQARISVSWGKEVLNADAKTAQKLFMDLVMRIVETEGPLRLETAIQRSADTMGISRVSPRIRAAIEDAIATLTKNSRLETRHGFLYPFGMTNYPARVARNGAPIRAIDDICLEEICEVILALLRVSFGMRLEELVIETARLFGYRSTSVNIRDRISEAVSSLELDDRIHITGGQIRTLETAGP